MKKLNSTAKLAFYSARKQHGDQTLLAILTGYSIPHINNMIYGRRKINETVANAMYEMSHTRKKNLVY